jgi:hypothetical protein
MERCYWLINGKIAITQYEGKTEIVSQQNLVIAATPKEAKQKFIQHWESKTSEYAVYYRVTDVEVPDVIE